MVPYSIHVLFMVFERVICNEQRQLQITIFHLHLHINAFKKHKFIHNVIRKNTEPFGFPCISASLFRDAYSADV